MSESTDRNKAVMRLIYDELWNKGKPAFAAQIFARPDGVEKFVREFLHSFPDLQHTVDEVIAEEDRIAVRFSARGTHSREWMGFAATGRSIHYTGVTWARISEGKVIEHHTWWDRAGLIEQVK